MDMLNAILHRRSVRQYTDESIPEEKLHAILCAGLSAASSKNRRPWELVVVQDRQMLDHLCDCRPGAGNLLEKCKAAIVVAADAELVDVWVEDCASAMTQMHLMADGPGNRQLLASGSPAQIAGRHTGYAGRRAQSSRYPGKVRRHGHSDAWYARQPSWQPYHRGCAAGEDSLRAFLKEHVYENHVCPPCGALLCH